MVYRVLPMLLQLHESCASALPHLEVVIPSICSSWPSLIQGYATISFGYSVSDFIAVGQLTWTVYKACKGAPGEFQELSRELSTLHTILHELGDNATIPTSLLNRYGSGRKLELEALLGNLSSTLKQVEDIVKRYHSLGRDQKKTWDRVKFATKDLVDLRSKLQFHINGINLFIGSLSAGSLARIELVLDELVRDVKAGRKEPSIVSSVYEANDELSWDELERELADDSITREDVKKYKEEIRDYLRRLMEDNICSIAGIEPAGSLSLAGGQVSDQDDSIREVGMPRFANISAVKRFKKLGHSTTARIIK